MIPPYKSNHASTIEILPDGTLAAAWFSGVKEEADNCAIVFATLPAGTTNWTTATTVSQREGYSNQNPELFYDNITSTLHLFHSQAPFKSGESEAWIWVLSSTDGGSTWSKPAPLFSAPGAFPRNRIIPGLDGTVLFPYYNASGKDTPFKANYAIIARSGKDHKLSEGSDWASTPIPGSANLAQPTVVRLVPAKSTLKAWFRDRRAEHIYTADSSDDGRTWSKPVPSGLPNPNVGIEAFPLLSGHVAMVFNNYSKATAGKHGRTPLTIAMSEDSGATWKYQRNLQVWDDGQTGPTGKVEYSYPTLLQSHDGVIHVMYTYDRATIKYIQISEEWIKTGAVSLVQQL